jgi:sarcosine oxidase gamma subunit
MTPSPNSRISSGFGSLQDEEGSINYESSYDHKSGQRENHSDSQYPHRDPNLVKNEQRSQEHERKRHRYHKHRRRRSHDTVSAERDQNHTTVHVLVSPRHEEQDAAAARVQGRDNNPHPPPPKGAWGASLTSPTNHSTVTVGPDQLRVQSVESSSDNQSSFLSPQQNTAKRIEISSQTDRSRNHVPKVISTGMDGVEESVRILSPPQAKMLSPRAEKQRQKLHSKQIELLNSREEKERLANEVNLLNLKVLEEGTK